MPTIDVDGATIAFTDTGRPRNRPNAATVVFGHGTLFSGWMFHHQIESLKHHYRCVAIDFRGHGDTPASTDGYDMDTLTHDAVAVINAINSGPVHWVGLSTGGFVGQRLAARHGELLRSLVLLDTSACAESRRVVRRNHLLARIFQLVGPVPLRPFVAPTMFGASFRASPAGNDEIAEWLLRLKHCRRSGIAKAIRAAMSRSSVEAELSSITVPSLVAVGVHDVATPPRLARQMADLIPISEFVVIPDSGHCSALEQPVAVTNLLSTFFEAVDRHRR